MSVRRANQNLKQHCLYVKIFFSDIEVANNNLEIVERFLKKHSELVDLFYFLFYGEGGPHIRLRVFGKLALFAGSRRNELLKSLEPRLNDSHYKVKSARYYPEFQRYGGSMGVQLHEFISFASSEAVLAFRTYQRNGKSISALEFAIHSIKTILDALEVPQSILQKCWISDQVLQKRLKKSRLQMVESIKGQILSLNAKKSYSADSEFSNLLKMLYRRLSPKRVLLRKVLKKNKAISGLIVNSYLHMHMNRLRFNLYEEMLIRNLMQTWQKHKLGTTDFRFHGVETR